MADMVGQTQQQMAQQQQPPPYTQPQYQPQYQHSNYHPNYNRQQYPPFNDRTNTYHQHGISNINRGGYQNYKNNNNYQNRQGSDCQTKCRATRTKQHFKTKWVALKEAANDG
eukprot:12315618-Ditylum_brightwellii.AAC.1